MKIWLTIGAMTVAIRIVFYLLTPKARQWYWRHMRRGAKLYNWSAVVVFYLVFGAVAVFVWPLALLEIVWFLFGKPYEEL